VALLVWGPAALRLADRDADIGWTDSQRAERIGLIVQNRRFLVLAKTRCNTRWMWPQNCPPFTHQSDELHHGRKERRVYKVYAVEHLRVGLPHIRSLVVREKTVTKTARKRFKVSGARVAATPPAKEVTAAGVEDAGEDPVS